MAAMQGEVQQLQRRVEGIVSGASSHIAEQAKVAVAPATAEVDRATAAFARQLQGAGRTLWTWYAGLAVLAPGSRLSVTPVSKAHWDAILAM